MSRTMKQLVTRWERVRDQHRIQQEISALTSSVRDEYLEALSRRP
jgi:hypothetical protein